MYRYPVIPPPIPNPARRRVPTYSPEPPGYAPGYDLGAPIPAPPDGEAENTTEKIELSEVGMTTETKDLYREDYRAPWEEWSPEDIGINSKSTSASSKFALIVRREKQNGDTEEPVLALHSITVHSPFLKQQLGPVFAGYQGINTNLTKLDFHAPFREFFYRWREFCQAVPSESDPGREHYDLLNDVMKAEIMPHIEQAEDLLHNSVVSFDYVWALFEPGTEVYSKLNDQHRLYLLTGGQYREIAPGSKIYVLTCRYIDYDGDNFGYATTSLSIAQFEDLKLISELSVVPSEFRPGIEEIRRQVDDRGRKFEALKGLHYKAYSGPCYLQEVSLGGSRKQYIEDGRVIVDCASFNRYDQNPSAPLAPLDAPATSDHLNALQQFESISEIDQEDDTPAPPTIQLLQYMARKARRRFAAGRNTTADNSSLSEGHYVLCTPVIKGYCLKLKEWVYLDVNLVNDIVFNENAFDQLVLPHDYKRVIWAFVEAQLKHFDDFDDVIAGKGKGIIMLLSGEPGTGKTLTSDSVSEAMRKPLYSLSAGELGNTADEVERGLQRVLELSTKWDAVLLLDECDVFLEQRSTSDLHRNRLVSVFLRLLEYYQGVMFLTTNRAGSFDPAFESRIHLTINYPKLEFESRLHVWRTFIKPRSATTSIQEHELEKLAETDFNGRQIKNVVKTARLLAFKDKILSFDHIQTVMRVKNGEAVGFGKSVLNGV